MRKVAPQPEGMHLSLPRNGFSITMGGLVALGAIIASIFTAYNWLNTTLTKTVTTLDLHTGQITTLANKSDAEQSKLSELGAQSAIAANNQKSMTEQLDRIGQKIDSLQLASQPRR
jgi:hypothetical protein